MVRFEVDRISNGYLVSYLVTKKGSFTKVYFENLNDCIKLLQSFVEKGDLKKEYKIRMGNSESPKHPYDRDEKYWDDESLQNEIITKLRKD
tara:strand:- start:608 stop:880 length:273 start_codon:yes stop_codon:yes gene_type:complete